MGELANIFPNLALGFSTAVSPINLFYCFIGVVIGTLVGVLPGIGPVAAIAMLLPLTFSLNAVGAIIMLAGIYYGSQYGGSTTSILVNIPGEIGSIVTVAIAGIQPRRPRKPRRTRRTWGTTTNHQRTRLGARRPSWFVLFVFFFFVFFVFFVVTSAS